MSKKTMKERLSKAQRYALAAAYVQEGGVIHNKRTLNALDWQRHDVSVATVRALVARGIVERVDNGEGSISRMIATYRLLDTYQELAAECWSDLPPALRPRRR